MGILCVVLFLQVSHKAHLEAVDVLNVPKDHFELVIIEHVHPLPTLAQVALREKAQHSEGKTMCVCVCVCVCVRWWCVLYSSVLQVFDVVALCAQDHD